MTDKEIKPEKSVEFRPNSVNKKLGTNLSLSSILKTLELLCFDVNQKSEMLWQVQVPSFRFDISNEADLIEEIGRLSGYDKIPSELPKLPAIPRPYPVDQEMKEEIRRALVWRSYSEVITYSFISKEMAQSFSDSGMVQLTNPISQEMAFMRPSIISSLMNPLRYNINRQKDQIKFFEIGKVFTDINNNFIEEEFINGAICGNNKFESWDNSGKEKELDYFEARGKLREALDSLKISIFDKTTEKYDFLHPGRTALLFIEGKESGYFGQIHPKYLMEKNILKNIYLFNIKLTNITEACTRKNKWNPVFKNYPTVPKIERDINFIFNKKYFINEILLFISKSGKKLLEDVVLVDIYTDESLGNDNISYTFRLTYRGQNKTLKDSDITELNNSIISNIENKYSAKIRSI